MSESILQDKLRRQLNALDDASFEALASRGLFRRARKDLESGIAIEAVGESAVSVRVRVGECEVSLPESGPAQARCSCPASGICQHILAACLWLRDQPATTVAASPPQVARTTAEELLAITPEQMEKWAGRAKLRSAFILAAQGDAEIAEEDVVTVTFRFFNATCRFVPGGGLDGVIVTCPPKETQRLALAALLVFQKNRGVSWEGADVEAVTALAESSGAPRSREEVLASAIALLCETVSAGIAHATSAGCERFATLSVSALAVNLPRLALALRGLSQELGLILARDAAADARRTFTAMARAYSLCVALDRAGATAPAQLVGWHRTAYSDVGHLELAGVAAWPWETASRYRGLTVLFWDIAARHWNTWSEARPRHIDAGYDPRVRFRASAPWAGADSPQHLSRSRFRLLHARRNRAGRLSASSKGRTLVTGATILSVLRLPICTAWPSLAGEIAIATPIGLTEAHQLDLIRVVRPASWERHCFDATKQIFRWPLSDAEGNTLLLSIRFNPSDEPAIKALEAFDPASAPGTCIIGRIGRTAEGLTLHPFSLLLPDGSIHHLVFDNLKCDGRSLPAQTREDLAEHDDDTEEEFATDDELLDAPTSRLLAGIEEIIVVVSEGGSGTLGSSHREELAALARRASTAGWHLISASVTSLARNPSLDPGLLMRCQYECLLYRQAIDADRSAD